MSLKPKLAELVPAGWDPKLYIEYLKYLVWYFENKYRTWDWTKEQGLRAAQDIEQKIKDIKNELE